MRRDFGQTGILGLGHALPERVRDNDDPIFAQLGAAGVPFRELFSGYQKRRVLEPTAALSTLMAEAAEQALGVAGFAAKDVGLLTGYASVSEFVAPNELFAVHRALGLRPATPVLPIADEFTAFLSGVRVASDHVRVGNEGAALVCCGCRWTANVDYSEAVSLSIGDGAGAALVAQLPFERSGSSWRLVADAVEVPEQLYAIMRLAPISDAGPTTLQSDRKCLPARFVMPPGSAELFEDWGVYAPARLAQRLLDAAGVDNEEVTCLGHQATRLLLDAWQEQLKPAKFADTLAQLGNMTLASLPVTFARLSRDLETRYVLLIGLGLGVHAWVCLLERW